MKKIWSIVNHLEWKPENKRRLFLFFMIMFSNVCGALLWLTIGRVLLPEYVWLYCFMGYPAVLIGYFGGIIYLYNHEFS